MSGEKIALGHIYIWRECKVECMVKNKGYYDKERVKWWLYDGTVELEGEGVLAPCAEVQVPSIGHYKTMVGGKGENGGEWFQRRIVSFVDCTTLYRCRYIHIPTCFTYI